MPDPERERLLAAYRATRYIVRDAGAEIAVRIGERSPALDALLAAHGAERGVFITAWNPGSRPQPRAANAAAAARMEAALAAAGRRWLPHEGRGEAGGWSEEGFFLLDMPAEAALDLAVRFGQNAVVEARRGAPARLLLTPLMPTDRTG